MTVIARSFVCAATLLCLTSPLPAQSVEELAGTWKRTGGQESPSVGVYTLQAASGKLTGSMTNPPQGFACNLSLNKNDGELVGTAIWTEAAVDMKIETQWELKVESLDTLSGRCEWKVWKADGTVAEQGWDEYQLERVKRIGLAVGGDDAEEPYGDPVPGPYELYGGYSALGGAWLISRQLGTYKIAPVGNHHEGVRVALTEVRGILQGKVTLADGNVCELELGYDESTRGFSGRCSWSEGVGEDAGTGWAPISFERLARIDDGPPGVAAEGPRADVEGSIAGVFRRENDGLYLRLQGDDAQAEGDLVDRDGAVKARVRLSNTNGVWRGMANFEGIELSWEFAQTETGLTGRSEFVDQYNGEVAVRNWRVRSFTRLKRVN